VTSSSGQVYVAMLRAINVGGRNRVAMKDLAALFAALPAEDVSTYVQSGNVVFRSPLADGRAVAGAAERLISSRLRLEVVVIVCDRDELSQVTADNPYVRAGRDEAKLHVTFLASEPDRDRLRAASAAGGGGDGGDEFVVVGRRVYLHCPDGYGRTKLNNGFFEKKLGVAATTRNWRSVRALADMAAALAGGR
jgi:uncharacterized protein (DUF1697 family)